MPALLSVTYTPNYIGNHRICFRTTQPSYCCYTDDSASVIGVPKTTTIDLDEFETCLQDLPVQVGCQGSVVEGYIQPFCVDQGSDLNRVSFSATYASNPCTSYKIECQESGIFEIVVNEPGYGWLPGEVPTVTITDLSGYGSGATAEAIMSCNDSNICFVESITVTDPGEFYYLLNQIVVDISLPTDPGGTPAEAQVTILDNCGTFTFPNCDGSDNPTQYQLWGGEQYAINVCAGGVGPVGPKYSISQNSSSPMLGPELVLNGDFQTDPTIEWTITNGSWVFGSPFGDGVYFEEPPSPDGFMSQSILTPGSTYEVVISSLSLGDFPEDLIVHAGTATQNIPIGVNSTITITCTGNSLFEIEAPALEKGILVTFVSVKEFIPGVSCCDCTKYDVINTALTEAREFYYTSCEDQSVVTLSIDPQDTIQICAVPGSFWVQNPDDNQYIEFVTSGIQDC